MFCLTLRARVNEAVDFWIEFFQEAYNYLEERMIRYGILTRTYAGENRDRLQRVCLAILSAMGVNLFLTAVAYGREYDAWSREYEIEFLEIYFFLKLCVLKIILITLL